MKFTICNIQLKKDVKKQSIKTDLQGTSLLELANKSRQLLEL